MSTRWFVKREDGERGPFEAADLHDSLRAGRLTAATLVRPELEQDAWRPLGEIAGDIAPPPPKRMPSPVTHAGSDDHSGSGGVNSDMMIGGIICVVGIVITFLSFAAASGSGGGRYIVAWGAIVFGGMRFLRGMSRR